MAGHLKSITPSTTARLGTAEYIWVAEGRRLDHKTKVIKVLDPTSGDPHPHLVRWSTTQSLPEGQEQIFLHPAHFLPDPRRPRHSFLVLCEVRDNRNEFPDINTRAKLRNKLEDGDPLETWWAFEQPFKCKAWEQKGSEFFDRFITCCVDSGLLIHSGQYDPRGGVGRFKVGVRHFGDLDEPYGYGPLVVADHLMLARFLLIDIAHRLGIEVLANGACKGYFTTVFHRKHPAVMEQATADKMGFQSVSTIRNPKDGKNMAVVLEGDPDLDPYTTIHKVLDHI